jgi:outer membrane lipoprotein carrier protein
LAAFFPHSSLYAQADLKATIAALQQRYATVDSIRADFSQTYRAPGIDETESGTLYMKKPGLMRWEYRHPEIKLFVADGRDTYLYTPEDRQVLVQRFTAADLHSTPLEFLLGRGDILRSFDASWEPDAGSKAAGFISLRLVPRSAQADYAYLVLDCDPGSYDISRIVIHELGGNTSQFVLSNVKTNIKIDSKQFEFKIPKGVEVVHLDEK